jgi:exodeoxyribonuclease-3
MRIATWNVNSVRQRIDHLTTWLAEVKPDVCCLQELKCQDEAFPRLEIEALGYMVETHGQKTFNGVAILSKHRLEDVTRGLPDQPGEPQSRYLEALITPANGKPVRVASLYAPNGNPLGTEKFPYKLAFLDALR